MKFDFSSKTILITGASSGIGKNFAQSLANIGASVIVGARNKEPLDQFIKEIKGNNLSTQNHLSYTLDVTDENSIKTMILDLNEKNIKIDGLVNNAGISRHATIDRLQLADWDAVINTNLRSQWLVTKYCLDLMNSGCSIINISSILSTRTRINSSYCASKAGSSHLTKSLAIELANRNIRVNAIAPGFIKTDLTEELLQSESGIDIINRTPLKMAGDVRDLEGALFLLLSEYSKFITGSIINVDGGLSANQL